MDVVVVAIIDVVVDDDVVPVANCKCRLWPVVNYFLRLFYRAGNESNLNFIYNSRKKYKNLECQIVFSSNQSKAFTFPVYLFSLIWDRTQMTGRP